MSNFNWVSPNDDNIAKRRVIKNQKKFFADYNEVIEEHTQDIAQGENIADLVIQQFNEMIILAEEVNAFIITQSQYTEEQGFRTTKADGTPLKRKVPTKYTVLSSENILAPNFYQGIVGLLGRLSSGCSKLQSLVSELQNYINFISRDKIDKIKNLFEELQIILNPHISYFPPFDNATGLPLKEILVLFNLDELEIKYIEALAGLMREINDSIIQVGNVLKIPPIELIYNQY